jgi:hypothetical protein
MIAHRCFFFGAAALVAMIVLLGTFASGQVQIVRHWSLYAASGPDAPYHLFIDPFPDARTCRVESAKIASVGGRAYCGSHLVLSFDRAREQRLFWEFLSVANPWSRVCGRRASDREVVGSSDSSAAARQ